MSIIKIGYILIAVSPLLYFIGYKRNTNIAFFLLYLLLTFFVEFSVLIFQNLINNIFIYNVFSFFEFSILFLFYYKISNNTTTKRFVTITVIIFSLFYLYFINNEISFKYNTEIPIFGAFLISIILVLYLREFLMSDKILDYHKNVFFWITAGFLFYYLGTLPLAASLSFFKGNENVTELYKIQPLLTVIMHACFIFGILWSWKKVR